VKVHPVVTEQGGMVSVVMQTQFIGDSTDITDKQRILALGDPQVNLGGQMNDPVTPSFVFTFPATELWAGVTTQMSSYTTRFMTTLPPAVMPGTPVQYQGPLDCITTNPQHAATVWAETIQTRVEAAMTTLRAQATPLTTLPDATA
jgi:hypothetical protein